MFDRIFKLKQDLQKNGQRGIALDIDETLSWTVLHYFRIVNEKFGNSENLSVKDLIKKYRYTFNVPDWQSDEVHAFLEDLRRNDEFHLGIPLLKNADKGIDKLVKIIPVVCYITARPIEVEKSTIAWLEKYKFPKVPLIFKPDFVAHSLNTLFKAELLQFLYPQVVGIIDDNPALVNFLPKEYQGKIFIYDFNEDNLQSSHPRAVAADNWGRMIEEIKKEFPD